MKAVDVIKFVKEINLEKYFNENNFGKIVGIEGFTKLNKNINPWDTSNAAGGEAFAPESSDLTRLYALIRKRKMINVLEFGSGKSTLVMAAALLANSKEYEIESLGIRRKNPFHIFSLESEKKYAQEVSEACVVNGLQDNVTVIFSEAEQTTFKNQICGKYKKIPSCCPDLIYIDGPMPMSYQNSSNEYINMNHNEITNITCDVLIIEPILLPGTVIIVDGMTNNSRFIRRNLQRNWLSFEDLDNDFTIMVLDEDPLSILHRRQLNFQNNE